MKEANPTAVFVRPVDYRDARDAAALVTLLDMYASDPMGGGVPLPEDVKQRLPGDLAAQPGAVSFIAWTGTGPDQEGETAVGLANCFLGFSTFKSLPLLNIHDMAVHPAHRGRGVGQALLAAVEQHARQLGCCKLTLEVLSGNATAQASYQRFGFAQYQLDPAAGQALFMQKWLNP
ncbi:GNAT family acetyltransferase [Hylemonella gracilis str. Niagara R]|uniref:GNAT family acetyltransferase n=1 Tax=Hylemonella gracilis str. Niagara R TaxID=1458275 RepID=A0A016XHU9_9BURK|nr:GNAT family N-acetyltransferase [Hylemonella gracilis]EYC51112.1 GNAT family acetyltransferase [Hylemonella gracilis str. Niagara R]